MTLFELLMKGGWVMVPLLLLSILTLYGLFERLLTLNTKTTISQAWVENIYEKIKAGDIAAAKLVCKEKAHTALAHVLNSGLAQLPHHPEIVEKKMEEAGQEAIQGLEKNLTLLVSIASIAPMLGFLGTVLGMIQAFMAMSQSSASITPQLLANGIYEAMITTACGLIVGIIADISYKYTLTQVEKSAYQLQKISNRVITILSTHYKTQPTLKDHEA